MNTPTTIQPETAYEVIEALGAQHICARTFGGVAISITQSLRSIKPSRRTKDIDIVVPDNDIGLAITTLVGNSWLVERRSLMVSNRKRIGFCHSQHGYRLDLFADPLTFNQTIRLGDRLCMERWTISLADLLLTKLQIVQLDRRDLDDIIALLSLAPLGDGASGTIELERVGNVCSRNWGFWYITRKNLILAEREAIRNTGDASPALPAIRRLLTYIESTHKAVGWRIRALFGPQFPWYKHVDA